MRDPHLRQYFSKYVLQRSESPGAHVKNAITRPIQSIRIGASENGAQDLASLKNTPDDSSDAL